MTEPTIEPTKLSNKDKYIKSLKEELIEINRELNDDRDSRAFGCKNTYKRNKEIEALEEKKWYYKVEIGIEEGRLEKGETHHSMVSHPDGRQELPFHIVEVLADGLKKHDVIVIVTARELEDTICTFRVERVNRNTITVSTSNQYGIIAYGSKAKLPKNTYPYKVVNKNICFREKGTFN